MIRLGVDGTAVKAGLGKVGSMVKAWGASIANGFGELAKGIMKGFIGAEMVSKAFEFLSEIKRKILEISHISKATGANTNFIQSMMIEAEKAGVPFEKLTQSIARFNRTLGAAKMGNTEALKTLANMGVVTSLADAKQLSFTGSMHNLAVAFDKLADKQKQAYLLQQAFGRGYQEMMPIFERGASAVDAMSGGNFFTKISGGTIKDFETMWRAIKSGSAVAMAAGANAVGTIFDGYKKTAWVLGEATTARGWNDETMIEDLASMQDEESEITNEKELQAAADKDGVSVAQKKTLILQQHADLLEKLAELSSQKTDRDKESVSEMANRARKLTGTKGPLENFHTVTARMRTALQIETLEERAKVAFLRDDDPQAERLQSEADQIRKSNTWLKRTDQNPMQKTEQELIKVNEQLEPVSRMADMITKPSTQE